MKTNHVPVLKIRQFIFLPLAFALVTPDISYGDQKPGSKAEIKAEPKAAPKAAPQTKPKSEFHVLLLPTQKAGSGMGELKLGTDLPGNVMEAKKLHNANGAPYWGVQIHAIYPKPFFTLAAFSKDVQIKKTGDNPQVFEISVPLHGDVTPLDFFSVSPVGKVEKANYLLRCERWKELKDSLPGQGPSNTQKRFGAYGTLGISSISYKEKGLADFSEKTITVKWGMNYALVPNKWDLGIGGYAALLPISTQPSNFKSPFIGVNIRLGYLFQPIGKWRLALYGGTYYATMLPNPAIFGFQNLMGPQLYPVIIRSLDNSSISAYAKFSPMGDSFSLKNFADHEFAFGLGWSKPLTRNSTLLVQMDYSGFSYNEPDFQFDVHTISLSVGLKY